MMSAVKAQKIFVGVDVSKFTLDVFHPDNSEIAVEAFCRSLKKKRRSVMVVMEATGGYETLLLIELAKHKIDAAVLNPKRVRDFAKGVGADAKTDPIDAQVISQYAYVVNPAPVAMKSDHDQKHAALVARRNQLSGSGCDRVWTHASQTNALLPIHLLKRHSSCDRSLIGWTGLGRISMATVLKLDSC